MTLARLGALVVIATWTTCGSLAPAAAAPILVDATLVGVVDVSGRISDTELASQHEEYVQAFQSLAVKSAIQIDGLPVTTEFVDLDADLEASVITPLPVAFTVAASDVGLEDFGASIQLNPAREITAAPSPETLVLLGLGLLVVGLLGRYVGHRRNRA